MEPATNSASLIQGGVEGPPSTQVLEAALSGRLQHSIEEEEDEDEYSDEEEEEDEEEDGEPGVMFADEQEGKGPQGRPLQGQRSNASSGTGGGGQSGHGEKKRVRRGGVRQRLRRERQQLLAQLMTVQQQLPPGVTLTELLQKYTPLGMMMPLGPPANSSGASSSNNSNNSALGPPASHSRHRARHNTVDGTYAHPSAGVSGLNARLPHQVQGAPSQAVSGPLYPLRPYNSGLNQGYPRRMPQQYTHLHSVHSAPGAVLTDYHGQMPQLGGASYPSYSGAGEMVGLAASGPASDGSLAPPGDLPNTSSGYYVHMPVPIQEQQSRGFAHLGSGGPAAYLNDPNLLAAFNQLSMSSSTPPSAPSAAPLAPSLPPSTGGPNLANNGAKIPPSILSMNMPSNAAAQMYGAGGMGGFLSAVQPSASPSPAPPSAQARGSSNISLAHQGPPGALYQDLNLHHPYFNQLARPQGAPGLSNVAAYNINQMEVLLALQAQRGGPIPNPNGAAPGPDSFGNYHGFFTGN